MTTVTVHLDEELLKEAQAIANSRHTSFDDVVADALKQVFPHWKTETSHNESREMRLQRLEKSMAKFSHFHTGGPYTRDEMNER